MVACRKFIASLAAASLLLILAAGCLQLPTSPAARQTPAVSAPGSAQTSGLIGTVTGLVGDLVGLVVRTLNLVGSLGGSLSNGRWRVDIPATAVEGTATVAIGVASEQSSSCQLEIWPASANSFSKPVTLTVDCRYVSSDQLKTYVIHWYDPSTQKWVPVAGSKVDLTTKRVSAPLSHFSSYAVGPLGGKGGW